MKISSDFSATPRSFALGLFVFFILSSLALLFTKFPPFMDEAIFFDMTRRLSLGLGLSTTLFRDFIPGVELHAYWYPPIYFYVLAPVFWLFGTNILVMRLFSLTVALLSLFFIFLGAKRITRNSWAGVIALGFLTIDHYFQSGALLGRMELLAICFGCGAIVLHLNFLKERRQLANVASGVLVVASCLTHPTGVIFVIPIGLNVLLLSGRSLKQKITDIFFIALPSLIGLGVWLMSVLPHWGSFVLQNQLQLHRKEFGEFFIWQVLKFQPQQRWILLGYFFSNVVFLWRTVNQRQLACAPKRLLFFLIISSSVLPILLKEMWYVIYIPVIGSLAFADNILWIWKKKPLLTITLGILFLLPNAFIFFEAIENSVTNRDQYMPLSKQISDKLPQNSRVLLSSIPDPYFYLEHNRPDLDLRETPNSPPREPVDRAVYTSILNQTDFVVLTLATNIHLYEYYQQNTESVITIETEPGTYSVQILKLLPLDQRKEFSPTTAKFWTYPEESE